MFIEKWSNNLLLEQFQIPVKFKLHLQLAKLKLLYLTIQI